MSWKAAAGIAAIALLVVVALFWQPIIVHVSQLTGTSNSSSRAYDFWSGFGSDIGEVTIITGIVLAYRHHNCHVKGCPRLGKPVDGTAYTACPKHHPAHQGDKRGVTMAEIHRAFHERRK